MYNFSQIFDQLKLRNREIDRKEFSKETRKKIGTQVREIYKETF